jgi:SsrA-binding protein
MAAKANQSSGKPVKAETLLVSENRKARHRYEILDTIECGMQLMGSEAKSLRAGRMSLDEAYGRVKQGELWLIGADIPPYADAGMWNHDPKRPRKLLAHRRELEKFCGRAQERGLTLVPLRIYFNDRGWAKCTLALAKGKKLHDKRESIKKAETQRGLQRAMRQRSGKR